MKSKGIIHMTSSPDHTTREQADLFAFDLDQPVETLARWFNELNSWKWPEEWHECRPAWYSCVEIGFAGRARAHAYIRPIMNEIERKIGRKEWLRWHHIHNIGSTDQEFEAWWANQRGRS